MFGPGQVPQPATKPRPFTVWVRYANSLLPVAVAFGALGLLLLGLSLLAGPAIATGARVVGLADLAVAALAASIRLWWRWRRRRSAR
jgi:hypothetical protein